MNKFTLAAAAVAGLSVAASSFAQAPAPQPLVSGTIASGAPRDITLEVKGGPGGVPALSAAEFRLVLGGYYRFNFVCTDAGPNGGGFHFAATDLLANSHVRVVSIAQMEVYMQGQNFRALECDDVGAARFSFHPMRKGTYELYVRDHSTPPKEVRGKFVVE